MVRLRQFLVRALRLGQSRRPSAAARTGKGAGRCGRMINNVHVKHMRSMYKIDRRGVQTWNHRFFLKITLTSNRNPYCTQIISMLFQFWANLVKKKTLALIETRQFEIPLPYEQLTIAIFNLWVVTTWQLAVSACGPIS